MIIHSFLDAIKTQLELVLDGSVSVEAHGGRFSESELNRLMMLTPCVLIAPLKIKGGDSEQGVDDGGGLVDMGANYTLNIGVYIITSSDLSTSFEEQINLTEKVSAALINQWFTGSLSPLKNFAASNLYTGSLDDIGAAMWLATFDAEIGGITND